MSRMTLLCLISLAALLPRVARAEAPASPYSPSTSPGNTSGYNPSYPAAPPASPYGSSAVASPDQQLRKLLDDNPELLPVVLKTAAESGDENAVYALMCLAKSAAPELAEAIESGEKGVRGIVLQTVALASHDPGFPIDKFVPAVLKATKDEDAEIAQMAKSVLMYMIVTRQPQWKKKLPDLGDLSPMPFGGRRASDETSKPKD